MHYPCGRRHANRPRCCSIRACRSLHEGGEFGEATHQCHECYQLVERQLAALAVAPALRGLVERHYYDTLMKLDAALQRSCLAFGADAYTKVRA
jgi:hypothetical protein